MTTSPSAARVFGRIVRMRGRRVHVAIAMLIVVAGLFTVTSVQGAGATTHPTYPLGKAKSCKAHYVKRTERHKVKGKSVRFVECIYDAVATTIPPTTSTSSTTTSTTTTTTLPGSIVIENGVPEHLVPTTVSAVSYYQLPDGDYQLQATVTIAGENKPPTTGSVTFWYAWGRGTEYSTVYLSNNPNGADSTLVTAQAFGEYFTPGQVISAEYSGGFDTIYANVPSATFVQYQPSSGHSG